MVISPWFIVLIVVVAVWELIWKGIALWRSGRNNQLAWFIVILIINSVGILPLVYLIWFDKPARKVPSESAKKIKKKR